MLSLTNFLFEHPRDGTRRRSTAFSIKSWDDRPFGLVVFCRTGRFRQVKLRLVAIDDVIDLIEEFLGRCSAVPLMWIQKTHWFGWIRFEMLLIAFHRQKQMAK